MIQLSVVIITYNEERNIRRCIESVQTVADEVVVLDSFSKDQTEAICRSLGVQFYQHAFDGHIQQKNRAITYARFPYILSLDADEALDETLVRSIREVKAHWTHDAYEMNRLTNYCGQWIRHCGWYPDKKLRLWDSRRGSWTGINPHDRYEMQPGSTQKHIAGNILHYSYYTIAEHYKQVEYFTTISAKAYYEKGKRSGLMKMLLSPVVKFMRDYFLKLGVLDGRYGFIVCRISAYATYLKYKKLRDLQHGKTHI